MESCGGMITAAVAERLGGYGSVCSAYVGSRATASDTIICNFNFEEKVTESVHQVPLLSLIDLKKKSRRQREVGRAPANGTGSEAMTMGDEARSENIIESKIEGGQNGADIEETAGAVTEACEVMGLPDDAMGAMPFTSCILAFPSLDQIELIRAVLPLLAPSAPFVMYGQHAQPLAECLDHLRNGSHAVNLMLQEAWMREIQVLPMRTHPFINMNHGGGYLLSGIVTLSGTQIPLAVPEAVPMPQEA